MRMLPLCAQGQENQKLMSTPGIKERIGTVGNQFAITCVPFPFVFSRPVSAAADVHARNRGVKARWRHCRTHLRVEGLGCRV